MDAKRENPIINILANIALPVMILNKTHLFPGEHKAILALVVALAFPLGYGLWDLAKNSRKNYFSALGLVNTLITGLFAIFTLSGIWFAVKEAAFPALLGVAVYLSSYFKKPFLKSLLSSSGLMKMSAIQTAAEERGQSEKVELAFLKSNTLFSISFFISAVLNFALAIYIFTPISSEFSEEQKATILNQQISQMTWKGMLVISLPMLAFLAVTFYLLFRNLKEATGLTEEEMLQTS